MSTRAQENLTSNENTLETKHKTAEENRKRLTLVQRKSGMPDPATKIKKQTHFIYNSSSATMVIFHFFLFHFIRVNFRNCVSFPGIEQIKTIFLVTALF